MIERTFPLHALPAFEAASRHGSFKATARELNLTSSAVSHQIKVLEEALGVALFRRLPRGLQLTPAGDRYASAVREVLARLAGEGAAIAGRVPSRQLRISMPDFVALSCALPALPVFQEAHPEIALSITTGMAHADLEGGEADLAIRLGPGTWRGLKSYKLTDFQGMVVAAPDLAEQARVLSERGSLPVVCLSPLMEHTQQMLQAAELSATPRHMVCIDNYVGLVRAAAQGLGVAVVYSPLERPFEPSAGLVALSAEPMPVPFAMFFVCRAGDAERPDVVAVRNWAQAHFTPCPWPTF